MKKTLSILLLLLVAFTSINGQDCLLDQKPVQDLVQDYAGILSDAEEQRLRHALQIFEDSTSTQIVVVTVTDLCGFDKAEFSYNLFTKLGIGASGKNNGVLIMLKPKKLGGRGEVFIETGYGMEGVLPDAIAKRIVENEMVPDFKQKDYFRGVAKAATTVMEITAGEYSADEYAKGGGAKSILPFLGVLFIFIIMIKKGSQTRQYASTNNLGFWAALSLMNASSRSHGGSFNDFGSGGGSFGGFGGGLSGGGGAGGSW